MAIILIIVLFSLSAHSANTEILLTARHAADVCQGIQSLAAELPTSKMDQTAALHLEDAMLSQGSSFTSWWLPRVTSFSSFPLSFHPVPIGGEKVRSGNHSLSAADGALARSRRRMIKEPSEVRLVQGNGDVRDALRQLNTLVGSRSVPAKSMRRSLGSFITEMRQAAGLWGVLTTPVRPRRILAPEWHFETRLHEMEALLGTTSNSRVQYSILGPDNVATDLLFLRSGRLTGRKPVLVLNVIGSQASREVPRAPSERIPIVTEEVSPPLAHSTLLLDPHSIPWAGLGGERVRALGYIATLKDGEFEDVWDFAKEYLYVFPTGSQAGQRVLPRYSRIGEAWFIRGPQGEWKPCDHLEVVWLNSTVMRLEKGLERP